MIPVPREKYKFEIEVDDGKRSAVKYEKKKVMNRLKEKRWSYNRFSTGLSSVDKAFGGGLPQGLTVFYGVGGSGKSMLAKAIAEGVSNRFPDDIENEDFPVLYVMTESGVDNPGYDLVHAADYTAYIPNWEKAVNELFGLIIETGVKMVVIDSVTNFLSRTRKAVEEADIRGGLKLINQLSDGVLPILAISQIRGSSVNYQYPAGGRAVDHTGNLICKFARVPIEASWDTKNYGEPVGAIAYTMQIEKDKQGLARQNCIYKVTYNEDEPNLQDIRFIARGDDDK